jgi:hypothetical protein
MIREVQRRVPLALLSVPLAGAGWLTAHSVAYRLAVPDSHDRAELLSATGHGYLELEPIFIACGLLLMSAGLFASVSEGIRDRPQGRLSVWLFALTPVLGFVVLEHLERIVVHRGVPYALALEPTFLIGVALQLPFAVTALSFSHGLHALARALGRLLRHWTRPARPLYAAAQPLHVARLTLAAALPLPPALVPGRGPRAPPAAPSAGM